LDGQDCKEIMNDGGNTAQSRNRLAGWRSVVRALAGGYALLVLAVVAFRGLVPGLVLGIVGIVVGVAVRKRFPAK